MKRADMYIATIEDGKFVVRDCWSDGYKLPTPDTMFSLGYNSMLLSRGSITNGRSTVEFIRPVEPQDQVGAVCDLTGKFDKPIKLENAKIVYAVGDQGRLNRHVWF